MAVKRYDAENKIIVEAERNFSDCAKQRGKVLLIKVKMVKI